MQIKRKITAALLFALCSASVSLPAHPALASAPFAVTGIAVMSEHSGARMDGDVRIIERNRPIRVDFNHPVSVAGAQGKVTVTDGAGNDAGWTADWGQFATASSVLLSHEGVLPKNASYTIRINGGADGLKDNQGATLPADQAIKLRTDSESVTIAADLQTNWAQSGLVQSEIYELKLSPGPLRIVVSEVVGTAQALILLEDKATGEVLLDQFVQSGDPVIEYAIEKEGSYLLLVAPNYVKAVTVHGQDLAVDGRMPGIKLPEIKRFETRNTPFTVAAQILNAPAASLELHLQQANKGSKVLAENAIRPDGSVAPVTIDPAAMEDGIYVLQAKATAKESGNMAVNARTFLVDRVSAFSDLPAAHWARRHVEVMHHLGIVGGRGAGTFAPGQPVTRAEFAKMLAGALGLEPSGEDPAPFQDLRADWSKPHIDALWELGLIKGESVNGKLYYYPDRTISRAEAATIVGRVLGADQRDISGAKVSFMDLTDIPAWAKPSVITLAEMKWINGFPDGRYLPMATLNRDQAAKVLGNFVGIQ